VAFATTPGVVRAACRSSVGRRQGLRYGVGRPSSACRETPKGVLGDRVSASPPEMKLARTRSSEAAADAGHRVGRCGCVRVNGPRRPSGPARGPAGDSLGSWSCIAGAQAANGGGGRQMLLKDEGEGRGEPSGRVRSERQRAGLASSSGAVASSQPLDFGSAMGNDPIASCSRARLSGSRDCRRASASEGGDCACCRRNCALRPATAGARTRQLARCA